MRAFAAGCHVFVEKPVATSVAEAEQVVAEATRTGRKLVVGYILRHHPAWLKFIELARTLGKPLVMRMNLNQQSAAAVGRTTEPADVDVADRGLRRALRRRHVPDDPLAPRARQCHRRETHR